MSAESLPVPSASFLNDLRNHLRVVAQQQDDADLMAVLSQERPYGPDCGVDDRLQIVHWRAAVKVEARRRGLIS